MEEALTLHDCTLNRIRLGDKNDGGYVIFDGLSYDGMVSGGIEYTNTFENEFIAKYDVDCHAFDNSIDELPYSNSRIRFSKSTIGKANNLSDVIEGFDSCFVKMDIEGFEWEWLDSLNWTTLDKITQLAIEFHMFHNMDDNGDHMKHLTDRLETLRRLNETHVMCHLHSNNYSPNFKYRENVLPQVFECTYINRKVFRGDPGIVLIKNIRQLPTVFDAPNCVRAEDNTGLLNYPPFVHSQVQPIKEV